MARSDRLPDRLREGLDIVSIGINPSLYTVERGFNFARRSNRFWPTFNACGLVPQPLEPGIAAVRTLLETYRIGFTDLVARPTARADELTEADYRAGTRTLRRKLMKYRPAIAWFQGVSAFQKYLEHAEGVRRRVTPGLQPETDTAIVTPAASSSAKNASWVRSLKAGTPASFPASVTRSTK